MVAYIEIQLLPALDGLYKVLFSAPFAYANDHASSVNFPLYVQAMGRIFVGLCQVGAWGCFDEFNRLEERMLSAVSQQVQCIQEALREHSNPNYDKST